MTEREREELVLAATTAFRSRDAYGGLGTLPAWHDLDEEGRREAFELTKELRALEASMSPDGLSTTGRAVLARIRRQTL
jgi:hypothetical protein